MTDSIYQVRKCVVCGHHRDFHALKSPTWCLHGVPPDTDPWVGDCDCECFQERRAE